MSFLQLLRRNFVSVFLVTAILVLVAVPGAKAYLLKAVLLTGLFNAGGPAAAPAGDNASLAELQFVNQQGTSLRIADLKGKVILINSWATWCAPCVAEMSGLNKLYNKLKDDNRFVFILADADNDWTAANEFMNSRHFNLPVYQVAGSGGSAALGNTLPTTLIIGSDGQLVQKHEGLANYDTDGMLALLRSL